MTTSRQRWRQCRSMGVPLLFAGRAANETNNLLRLHGALYSHLSPPAAPCPGGGADVHQPAVAVAVALWQRV